MIEIRGKCGTVCNTCSFKDRFGCKGCEAQQGKTSGANAIFTSAQPARVAGIAASVPSYPANSCWISSKTATILTA